MSALSHQEILALRVIRAVPSSPTHTAWAREIADQLRIACSAIDDATLAHVLIQVLGVSGRHAFRNDLSPYQTNDLLARAAAELAGLELDAPVADGGGDGKT